MRNSAALAPSLGDCDLVLGDDVISLTAGDLVLLPHGQTHSMVDGPTRDAVRFDTLARAENGARNQISWQQPKGLLCFSSHQGYICEWFDRDDPSAAPRLAVQRSGRYRSGGDGRCSECLRQSLEDLVALGSVTRSR